MKRPKWAADLPEWATFNETDGRVEVDPDVVYPLFLAGAEPTQISLDAARKKFTKILRDEIVPTGQDLYLRILQKDEKWALKNFPVGDGPPPSIAR